jgi:hypothetical protein
LLAPLHLLWLGLLHLLPHGLHDPLFQLSKNGPDGLRDVLLHGLVQGLPGTRRLCCPRDVRLLSVWWLLRL